MIDTKEYKIMVTNFVEFLIQNGALDEKYREDSIYGLTIVIEKIIAYMLLFCTAFLVGNLTGGIMFTVSFVILRQITGGFHAKTFLGCLIGSTITLLLAIEILVPLAEQYTIIFGGLLLLSVCCILLFAPVNHPDLLLTEEEERRHRSWGKGVLSVEMGIVALGYILQEQWQQYIMIAIIMCAVFILIAKIVRQEVRRNDEKEKPYA